MQKARIIKAKQETERFMSVMKELLRATIVVTEYKGQGNEERHIKHFSDIGISDAVYDWPKLTGALRRASMDLTRALAEMRRP